MGSRGAVVSAALSERKVAGSISTIGDCHTVGPCKKAVFACLATDVKTKQKKDTFNFTFYLSVLLGEDLKNVVMNGSNNLAVYMAQ